MDIKNLIHLSADEVKSNARIRYIPDENGIFQPYEILVFPKSTFVKPGWELSGSSSRSKKSGNASESILELFDSIEGGDGIREAENRRKSFSRSRNNLFNLLLCTLEFNCFVTLTLSADKIDRYDYSVVMKKLTYWLDNRVRRNGLVYALVPELHKDGAIHFHGLMNFDALKTVRASQYGKELFDNHDRPIFNISDFPYGFTTVIPLSGDNARIATAKYCYKYITKSHGKKIGGRYYLSGGKLGRPKYEYVNLDFDEVPAPEQDIGCGITFKKWRL